MNWVEFEDVTFNLDQVTHFEIIGNDEKAELRAYLNIGYPKDDKLPRQAYITIAKGTKGSCKNSIKEIIAGKYNLPCKGHLYPIREHLNQMNINLGEIGKQLKLLTGIKQ